MHQDFCDIAWLLTVDKDKKKNCIFGLGIEIYWTKNLKRESISCRMTEMKVRKVIFKNINNCISRLNDFQQKLEETNERLSKEVDGQEGEDEITDLIQGDWEYISTVMDCRDELVDLYSSLQEQESPRENCSSVTDRKQV